MKNILLKNRFYEYRMMICDDNTLRHISFLPVGYPAQVDPEKAFLRYWPYPFESQIAVNSEGFNSPHGNRSIFTGCSKRSVVKEEREEPIPGGTDHVILLEDEKTGLLQELHYEVYEHSPAIRRYTRLTNTREKPILVQHMTSFMIGNIPYFEDDDRSTFLHSFKSAWCYEGNHEVRSFGELELYSVCSRNGYCVESPGTWVCQKNLPSFIIEQRNAGLFTMVQLEVSESWRFEIGNGEAGHYNWFYVQGGCENELHSGWSKLLHQGEWITSPAADMAVAAHSYENVLNAMHDHQSRVLIHRSEGDRDLPVIYNDWLYRQGASSEESILSQLDMLEKYGVEVFVTDAGWFMDPDMTTPEGTIWPMTGSWVENKERFPHGLAYVADEIRRHHMKAGIWCEIEAVGELAPLYNDKEMLLCRGDDILTDGGHRFLNFTSPKVIDYVNGVFQKFADAGFEYVKIDYNSDSAPGADNCGDANIVQGLYNNRRAYDRWLRDFRARNPQMIIESCSSGGMRLEYNSLSIADLASLTDQADFRLIGGMAMNVTKVIHPTQMGIWAYTSLTKDEREFALALTNAMIGRIHLSGDFSQLSPGQDKLLADAVALYRSYRHILYHGRLHYHSGFHYLYDNDANNLCCEIRSEDNTEAVVFAERTGCAEVTVSAKLEGLVPGTYQVKTFPAGEAEDITVTDRPTELRLTFDTARDGKILYLKRITNA